tara:strand:+ start:273 stop:1178 length:906 start_codon:yes stop_codon:yes gene_type:complete
MNCVIIGSTKIAEVHAEQLINNGVKEITFVSRSIKKRKKIILNVKGKISKKVSFFHSDINVLRKKFFNIICICSNTKIHHTHLKIAHKFKSVIIIEKPIISLLKFKDNYESILKNFYKKNKKIIVCYPFLFLAKSFKKFLLNDKKIKKISFDFQTGGKENYENICINLMPHALTFFHIFLKNNIFKRKVTVKDLLVKKNQWRATLNFDNFVIKINLKENLLKKTILKIKYNNLLLVRKTKSQKNNFINYIVNQKTKKEYIINNPMGTFYKRLFRNINNKNFYHKNKILTFNVMKMNNFLLS